MGRLVAIRSIWYATSRRATHSVWARIGPIILRLYCNCGLGFWLCVWMPWAVGSVRGAVAHLGTRVRVAQGPVRATRLRAAVVPFFLPTNRSRACSAPRGGRAATCELGSPRPRARRPG